MMAASKAMKQRVAEDALLHVQSRSLSLTAALQSNNPPSDLALAEISSLHLQAEREVANFRRQDIDPVFEHTVYNPLEALRNALKGAASPLRRFPSETMSEIFAECLSYLPNDEQESCWNRLDITDAPWTLTRVCRRWRAIALTDQRLWSRIKVNLWAMAVNGQPEPTLKTLSTCLERSGEHPLSISFTDIYPSTFASKTLFLHLMPHAHRWTCLFLNVSFGFLEITAPLQGRLPELQTFAVVTSGRNNAPTTFDGFMVAPKLRNVNISINDCTVDIKKYVPNGIRLPWYQLTSIVIDSFDILPFLPQLIHCFVRGTAPAPQKMVRHQTLRSLRLEGDLKPSTLDWLELPSLVALHYSSFSLYCAQEQIISFLHRSRCPLETLSLDNTSIKNSASDFAGLIESTPYLKSFTLSDRPLARWSIFWEIFTPTTELPVLAPKLEHITLKVFRWNPSFDLERLVVLLESRCGMVDSNDTRRLKSVTLFSDKPFKPAPHLLQRLARLRETGLKMMLGLADL